MLTPSCPFYLASALSVVWPSCELAGGQELTLCTVSFWMGLVPWPGSSRGQRAPKLSQVAGGNGNTGPALWLS